MKRPRGAIEVGAEILATFLKGSRTQYQLQSQVGTSRESTRKWIHELRAAGILRISGYSKAQLTRPGRYERIYELQKPFENDDAIHPLKPGGVRLLHAPTDTGLIAVRALYSSDALAGDEP